MDVDFAVQNLHEHRFSALIISIRYKKTKKQINNQTN